MKIGIISDTHDNVEGLKNAIREFNKKEVDLVFHCGDWVAPFMAEECKDLNCNMVGVFGNNDGDLVRLVEKGAGKIEFSAQCAEKEIAGRSLAIYHGTSAPLLDSLLNCGKYDAIFSGHTHSAFVDQSGDTLHVNPGSPSFPRKGFASVAIYDTESNTAEIIQLKQDSLF